MENMYEKVEKYRKELVGKRFRHFKGDLYEVTGIVPKRGTCDIIVIYHKVGDNKLWWLRPLNEFMSPVDKERYPDIKQKLQFEEVK